MENEEHKPKREIHDVGILDFRSFKSAEELSHISAIRDVGVILIPESLAGALAQINIEDVGSIVPVPDGGKVNCMTGQTRLTGESLENGDPDTILLLVGQTFITTPCKSVGYKEVRVHGQFFATRGSEAALAPKLASVTGQNFYIAENPRFVMGQLEVTAEYLGYLEDPIALVIMGQVDFARDVSVEQLRSKVKEIVLMGQIKAPAHLIAILEVITKEKMGSIDVIHGEG